MKSFKAGMSKEGKQTLAQTCRESNDIYFCLYGSLLARPGPVSLSYPCLVVSLPCVMLGRVRVIATGSSTFPKSHFLLEHVCQSATCLTSTVRPLAFFHKQMTGFPSLSCVCCHRDCHLTTTAEAAVTT